MENNYLDFLKNEELTGYGNFLKSINFSNKLKKLAKKYNGKKILIYGNGVLFDAMCLNYSLKDYLNIVAVSDLRYEKSKEKEYRGFKTVTPSNIVNIDAEVVLVTTVNPKEIKAFLIKNNFVKPKTIIEPLIQNYISEKIAQQKNKLKIAVNYLFQSKNPWNTLKYLIVLNDTEYNSKNNYTKIINKLRKDKNKKIRVVFLCEENAKWGYQSIYDEMKKDDNFEVLPIVTLPIITYRRQEFLQDKNIAFFNNFGMEAIDGYDYEKNQYHSLEDLKPDIVFYQQPWYMIQKQIPSVISEYALTCIISYGFTSINTETWGSEAIRKNSGNIWCMFAESKYHNKFYQKAAELKHKDILVTKGYPKLDNYKLPISERFEKLWKGENVKGRIIWAPHHSIEKYGFEMSNFKEHYQEFLAFAKHHPEYSFIVKPHPALRYKCISEKFLTAEQYDAYMGEWNSLPNGTVYTDGNYFDIFKTSDLLITDSSSFLAEYFYSQKPIVFFESKHRAGFNEFGLKIKKGFYTPNKISELDDLIEKILIKKEDNLLELRKNIIKNEFYCPDEGIGKNIVKYLKSELNR